MHKHIKIIISLLLSTFLVVACTNIKREIEGASYTYDEAVKGIITTLTCQQKTSLNTMRSYAIAVGAATPLVSKNGKHITINLINPIIIYGQNIQNIDALDRGNRIEYRAQFSPESVAFVAKIAGIAEVRDSYRINTDFGRHEIFSESGASYIKCEQY